MSQRNPNLGLLVPRPQVDRDIPRWATVTQTSPLRIKMDGESSALPFAPDTLVPNLALNDRVRVEFATNGDPSTLSRRCIVTGRAGVLPQLVMNLAQDPGATAFHSTVGRLGWRNTRWFGTGGAGTHSISSVTGPTGFSTLCARKTWTTAPSGNGDTGFECSYGWSATDTQGFTGIRPNYPYNLSAWVRTNASGGKQSQARIQWHDSGGVVISPTSSGPNVTLTANTWARVQLQVTAPSNAVYATVIIDASGGTTWAINDNFEGTWLMLVGGDTLYDYMDGGQPGGIWLGTANASYSQGYTMPV